MKDARGNGFLTHEAEKWLNAQPNEQYIENPVFYRHKFDETKPKLSSVKKKAEQEDVLVLPDTVGKQKRYKENFRFTKCIFFKLLQLREAILKLE